MIVRIVILFIISGMISCKDNAPVIPDAMPKSKKVKVIVDSNPSNNNDEVKSLATNHVVVPDFDENILAGLIIDLVNFERRSKNLESLENNTFLRQAATAHNTYITSLGTLTHNGNTQKTYDLRSRVKTQGGSFNLLAENIAMKSFFFIEEEGEMVIKGHSYNDIASQFFEMWKNSPGHYKNMMIEDLQHIGISTKWNHNQRAIYATQVFGG